VAKQTQSLATMSVDALLALRDKIGTVLNEKTAEIRKQLQRPGFRGPNVVG
jgi:hypothetical protein